MWKNEDIQLYFSLFGASPETLEKVKEENLTQEDMDALSIQKLISIGLTSKNVCVTMITQWKTLYSHEKPMVALEAIQQAMEAYSQVLAYKADRNEAVYANVKQDAVDTLKHTNLLQIIRDQDALITALKDRESAFVEELEKRADLVKQLEGELQDLSNIKNEKSMSTEEIKKYITQNHSLFHQKIDDTKVNVSNIDHHVNSILRMAKRTVDLIQEEERNRCGGNIDTTVIEQNIKTRLIQIDQVSIEGLKKQSALKASMDASEEATLDPFVIFKVTDDDAFETTKLFNSDPNPCWNELNIELQATDDHCNPEYNKLIIEVWDDFAMNLSNELLCAGEISFKHLDLLLDRGLVMTSVDLLDSTGIVMTTARININVTLARARAGNTEQQESKGDSSSLSSTRAQYDINQQVLCNYGGEGEWLLGKILRFKNIRDRADTRRLYEVEFANEDLEINVPISRLSDVPEAKQPSIDIAKRAGDSTECTDQSNEHLDETTELSQIFQSNNAELLQVITTVEARSHDTVASIKELDEWQKTLTKLLSDALHRYFDINASAKKYSVYVNSLTEKIGNIEHFLQRLELSEQRNDDLNGNCDKLRAEMEDLRKQLAAMTEQRDAERDRHTHTKHALEQEQQVTVDCKKEIIDLRSELDHLIEVVRRDMSNRITNKNVNEELYSLSSKLVKTDLEPSSASPNPPPMPVTHSTSATDHDDIFMQQHDWKLFLSLIKTDMTSQEVGEAHATLHNLNKSFEILSSRLLLECRHRADCEFKLLGAKENLRDIKDDIINEATLRLQLEEEMQYFKETTEKYKEEVEKHKKFSVIAKKAAYDAIKQARYFQRKLNIEIDNIHEGDAAGFGESKHSSNNLDSSGGSKRGSPHSKSNRSSNKVVNLEDYDGLFDDNTTDDDSGMGGDSRRGRRKLTRSSTGPASRGNPNSPYLNGRNKNRNNPYHNLQTRSENEKDYHTSEASVSSKKSKKIKMPGKKQMSYVGKKITRVLFDGKGGGSKSSAGITPYDDASCSGRSMKSTKSSKSAKSPHKSWVNPGHVNYAEKYGKEPPTAASRRSYTSQQQYD